MLFTRKPAAEMYRPLMSLQFIFIMERESRRTKLLHFNGFGMLHNKAIQMLNTRLVSITQEVSLLISR